MPDTELLLDNSTLPEGAVLRPAHPTDAAAISGLHERVFGPGRFARTAYRIREGTPPTTPHCRLIFIAGELVAALRMTPVTIGGKSGAILLGPLAVHDKHQRKTFGRRLIAASIASAKQAGFALVILVGDLDYYGPLGFVRVPPAQITLPGPVDPRRLLASEREPGDLASFRGIVAPETDPKRWDT